MKRLHKRFLLATFCTLFTATLQAADVTITVNGRVVAKPCTIQTKEANVNKSKVPLGLSATYGQTGNKVAAGAVQSVIGVTFIYE